ncbi:MAG: hypothetical protein KF878_18585, partial [Planctomycetes bacterium]|nr:hypothetical protein [Planctomycetota bacterium]
MRPTRPTTASLLLACALLGGAARADEPRVTWADHVAPIMEQACTYCHDAGSPSGGLDLTSYSAAMSGGGSGAVIAPGDPGASRLFRMVTRAETPFMPDDGSELSPDDVATLRRWIAQGALETSSSPAPARRRAPAAVAAEVRPLGDAVLPAPLPLAARTDAARPASVLALAASPTAPLLAVAGHREVLLYDGAGLGLLGVLPFPAGGVHALRFTPDGRLLLAAGGDGAARGSAVVFEVATGLVRARVDDARDAFLAADLREDHTLLAVGGPLRVVDVYRVATGERAYRLEGHTNWITAVAFSPDGALLATGDRAGGVTLWEAETGREYLDLEAHGAAVTAIAWRRDGDLLCTSTAAGQLRLFQAQDGKKVKEWAAHPGGAQAVTFSPDGRLVSTGRDAAVALWKPDGAAERRVGGLPELGLAVAVAADAGRAFAGDLAGGVHTWGLADAAAVPS